MIIYIKLYLI